MLPSRRSLLFATLASAIVGTPLLSRGASAQYVTGDRLSARLFEIVRVLQCRLGVMIFDTESGRRWRHRADERFPMASTFKAVAGAALLARVDAGLERLDRRVILKPEDIVTYSPVTKELTGETGLSLAEICDAAITRSDNTAANLILRAIGGPEGFNRFVRGIGDAVTRIDRCETALSEAKPGDSRDTTSPAAITETLRKLVLGDALQSQSRDQLTAWLLDNTVSDAKLKAGLPKTWRVADRTGAAGFGTNNVIGLVWPPARKPILISVFVTETSAIAAESNAAMAEIARVLHATIEAG